MEQYTYSTLLEDFIKFEYEMGFFDITINDVFVWTYLRFFVYNIVKDKKIAKQITHTSPVVRGVDTLSVRIIFNKYIRRNIFFAHKKDALIVSHGRKIEDEDGYYKDWNTGNVNENLNLSHYLLDRSNTNEYYYPNRMHNILEYHLYRFGKIMNINNDKNVVHKDELYLNFLKPIEEHYFFSFSTKEKNAILGYADARVSDNKLLRSYVSFVIKRVRPKVIILGMITDSIMQVFCEVAHEKHIPTIYIQEGVMFEAIYCYYYMPQKRQNRFFTDYVFCYGDYEKESLKYLPIDSDRIIPVGFPELDSYDSKTCVSDIKKIMIVSSATKYLAEVAGQLSEILDENKYKVLYKIHPREIANYDSEIFPITRKYRKLEILGVPSIMKNNCKDRGGAFQKAYRYFGEMTWIVGTASATLFEATKFKKKIAIVDLDGEINSPLIEKKSAIRVRTAEELAEIIKNDSFAPDFSFRFYYDNSIDTINREVNKIIQDWK